MLQKRRTVPARAARGTLSWDAVWAQMEDVSSYAAYLGYDGVVGWQSGVRLMLNRTALRIQDRDLAP
jgi:hypothetical protein